MRVAVIGSRDYPRLSDVDAAIDALSADTVVVSGGARGVDRRARDHARARGLEYDEFLADWEGEGKRAGPLRNERMLSTVDAVIALWDGESPGTKHAMDFAASRKIPVTLVEWEPNYTDLNELLQELRRMHSIAAQHGFSMLPSALRALKWLAAKGFERLSTWRS